MKHPLANKLNDYYGAELIKEYAPIKSIKELLGSGSFYRQDEKTKIAGVVTWSVIQLMIHNSLPHIEMDAKEWSSNVSRDTLLKMEFNDFKIPYANFTIIIEGRFFAFLEKDVGYTIAEYGRVQEEGSFFAQIESTSDLHRCIKELGEELFSAIFYVATFKDDKERIPSAVVYKAKKSKGTPRHTFSVIRLKQRVNGGVGYEQIEGRNKSDKMWIVRGHWRKQWYIKEEKHKPKWIDAYWKGEGIKTMRKVVI